MCCYLASTKYTRSGGIVVLVVVVLVMVMKVVGMMVVGWCLGSGSGSGSGGVVVFGMAAIL